MSTTLKVGATFAIIVLLLAGLTACVAESVPKLRIQDSWAYPTAMPGMGDMNGDSMGGGSAAVYFTIINERNRADTLVGASSEAAQTAETHETRMEGDIMRMVPVPHIELPAGRRTELKPGGLHLMLVGLKRDLNPGDTITIRLRFETSSEMTVTAEVRQP